MQHEGAEQQRPPGPVPAPARLGVRLLGEQQEQQRQQEGRELLQEPPHRRRTAATLRPHVAAVLRAVPRLVQQESHARGDQSPAQVGHNRGPTLHQ